MEHQDYFDNSELQRNYEENVKSLEFIHEFISTFSNKASEIKDNSLMTSFADIRSISNWYHSFYNLSPINPSYFSVFGLAKKIFFFFQESISKKKLFIKYGQGEKLRAFSVVGEIRDILLIVCQGIIDEANNGETLIISCKRERTTVILNISIPTLVDVGMSENLSRMQKNHFVSKYKKPPIYLEMIKYYCKKNQVHIAINRNENGKIIDIKVYLSVE